MPRLKRFKQLNNGSPLGLSFSEWDAILDKMIAAFEFYASEEKYDAHPDEYEEHQEGLDLFAKYFGHLWW